jgi:very-short-patch-repair endonuclease
MAFIGKTIDYLLHFGANEETFRIAKNLRKNPTSAESILWMKLKNRQVAGAKFRRQHPLRFYIADFYCHEHRLVIEIDGDIHFEEHQKEHDVNRSAELEKYGIHVLRFTNDQVLNSIDEVINSISDFIQNHDIP